MILYYITVAETLLDKLCYKKVFHSFFKNKLFKYLLITLTVTFTVD